MKWLLLGLLCSPVVIACSASAELTDAEKQERIRAMYAKSAQSFPSVRGLTVGELDQLAGERRVVLVDVREDGEQAISMLPGAITVAELEGSPADYADAAIVTYCTIGHRSGLYAAQLQERGIEAFNLAGSVLAWSHAGRELVGPDGEPTRRLHVYGEPWDLAASGYETTW